MLSSQGQQGQHWFLLEPVIHLSIDLEHEGEEPRRSRDRTGSGMKTDVAGQGVEPRTPDHGPTPYPQGYRCHDDGVF